jgi:hypothetical protein
MKINILMTWTNWKSPRQQAYVEDDEIQFAQKSGTLSTLKPVSSRANFFGELVTSESTAIVFTDFGFDVGEKTVQEIELYLHVSRLGRTQDKTIKIWNGERIIGKNQANLEAEDKNTYSGTLKVWEVNTAKNIPYGTDKFGIYIDLQPHTEYPSSVIVYLRDIKMRLKLQDPIQPE